MTVETRNEPTVSKVTHPVGVKHVHYVGMHRPNSTPPPTPNAARPVTPSAAKAASGLPTPTETQVAPEDGEQALLLTIERLHAIHKQGVSNIAQGQQKKRAVRAELGKYLSELKTLYASPGCKGQWLAFLRRLQLHRSTAEGLINRHLGGGVAKKSALDLPELTAESIAKLLKALKPKLLPVNTRELVDLFVRQLTVVLDDQVAQRTPSATILDESAQQFLSEIAKPTTFDNFVTIDDL